MTPDPWCEATGRHGDRIAHMAGCRCASARAAEAAYRRALRAERSPREIDATGTQRRLRALYRMGWTGRQIGARLGVTHHQVSVLHQRHTRVFRTTAAKVAAVYDELSMKVGPSEATRAYAIRRGWPPPLAWDDDTIDDPKAKPAHRYHPQSRRPDEVAILRRLGGDAGVTLNRVERRELVARLHALGFNDQEIAIRTGLWDRVILRDRQALGLPANADARGNIRDRRPA